MTPPIAAGAFRQRTGVQWPSFAPLMFPDDRESFMLSGISAIMRLLQGSQAQMPRSRFRG
jgi:hypothetical protein